MSAPKERKSPSRKQATTDSDRASSSVAKSPTRRTPTRSTTKSKTLEVEQEGSKRKTLLPKAAKLLGEKFTLPKPLGGIDAATLFDMSVAETSTRNRTLSDSEVPKVEEKRRRTHKIVGTVVEVDDETGM
ncbi:hypothetical protein COOONC_13010 [Cooperia oncophora]